MKRPERLPSRLLKAVFQPPDYILDNRQWDEQVFLLKDEFLRFSQRKQQLILRFYAEKISIIALAAVFNISAKACSRELHRGVHELRKAANPLYRAAIDEIHGRVAGTSPINKDR